MRILALLPLILIACTAEPERSPVPEDINTKFLDANLKAADWVRRWEIESREIYAERAAIVAAVELRSGETVADVGTGTGLFVAPFSGAVGSRGTVFAMDISTRFVEHVAQRARDEGLHNVRAVLSAPDSTKLKTASVDAVFLCDTYHHFEHHRAMLASIRDALRPGGRLVVVDFERIPGKSREWVLGHVRAGKETFTREIVEAGFELQDEIAVPGLKENYLLRFRRR